MMIQGLKKKDLIKQTKHILFCSLSNPCKKTICCHYCKDKNCIWRCKDDIQQCQYKDTEDVQNKKVENPFVTKKSERKKII